MQSNHRETKALTRADAIAMAQAALATHVVVCSSAFGQESYVQVGEDDNVRTIENDCKRTSFKVEVIKLEVPVVSTEKPKKQQPNRKPNHHYGRKALS